LDEAVNIDELRRAVEGAGISPADYRIMDQPEDSTLCITRQGRVWQVFYFERGTKRRLERFRDESAACGHFLSMLGIPQV
jgi:hypothetical protein